MLWSRLLQLMARPPEGVLGDKHAFALFAIDFEAVGWM
jgi:hypothetical protein